MGQFPVPIQPWLTLSGRMLVSQEKLLRKKHDILGVPKTVQFRVIWPLSLAKVLSHASHEISTVIKEKYIYPG